MTVFGCEPSECQNRTTAAMPLPKSDECFEFGSTSDQKHVQRIKINESGSSDAPHDGTHVMLFSIAVHHTGSSDVQNH